MAQWNKNTVPKCKDKTCSDEVLVTIEKQGWKGGTYRRVVKAVYIPYHHCTVEDMGWNMPDGVPDDWEYVEENDKNQQQKDLKVESLDDLFEDVPNDTKTHKTQEKISGDKKLIENTNEMDNLIDNNVQSNNTSEIDSVILPQGNDDNDEELFTIDVQKEIEAKFDELFGDITENNNTNKN